MKRRLKTIIKYFLDKYDLTFKQLKRRDKKAVYAKYCIIKRFESEFKECRYVVQLMADELGMDRASIYHYLDSYEPHPQFADDGYGDLIEEMYSFNFVPSIKVGSLEAISVTYPMMHDFYIPMNYYSNAK